jgi:hypothetical protein
MKRKNSMCVLSPCADIAIEEEKSNVRFELPFGYCERRGKIQCALNPHESIAIE